MTGLQNIHIYEAEIMKILCSNVSTQQLLDNKSDEYNPNNIVWKNVRPDTYIPDTTTEADNYITYSISGKAVDKNNNVVDTIKFVGYVPLEEHDVYVTKPTWFQYDNKIYRPKNQKLFSFPYMFISVDNCENSEAYYAFENFSDGEISGGFKIANDYISGTSTCIPKNYLLGEGNNTINKNIYPVLSTNSSPYNEYIGQLKAKYMGESVTNLLTTGIQGALIGGGVIGAGIGVTIGAFAQAIKAQTEAESAKLKSSTPTGAVGNLSLLRSTATRFEIRVKLIRPEIARSIDGFFTKFGYKVNELKTPSFADGEMRLNWKFIKTNGCAIDGYAPATDMSKIEEIMDNGITFWKTKDVGDYTFPTQGGE